MNFHVLSNFPTVKSNESLFLQHHESHNHHAYIKNPQGFWVSRTSWSTHHQKKTTRESPCQNSNRSWRQRWLLGSGINFCLRGPEWLPALIEHSTWKWMVGRWNFLLGWPIFRCYVSFSGNTTLKISMSLKKVPFQKKQVIFSYQFSGDVLICFGSDYNNFGV